MSVMVRELYGVFFYRSERIARRSLLPDLCYVFVEMTIIIPDFVVNEADPIKSFIGCRTNSYLPL